MPSSPESLDLNDTNIRAVIWATGFKMHFDWVNLPVFNEGGHPKQIRGVTDVPGMYFLGLNWMHTWGSGRFFHVGNDAGYLTEEIVKLRHRK